MPSPFPGMDPYLEGSQWLGVHTALGVEIARRLTPLLPARYVARANERLVITTEDTGPGAPTTTAYPDAFVADGGAAGGAAPAGVAVEAPAVAPPALRVATVMPEAQRHVTVEIHDAADRRLVTAIEVLSPTNKRGDGRGEYLAERQRVLLSPAHLMEIDLLRSGQRVPMREALPADVPYFVLLSRAERRPLTDVWPIRLSERLPVVPVPLLAGDGDVPLDLQAALTGVYDALRYDRTADYARPPEVPLSPADAAWAAARGLTPAPGAA